MLGRLGFRLVTFFAAVAVIVLLRPALTWLAGIVAGSDDGVANIVLLLGGVQAFIGLLIGQCASDYGSNGISDYLLAPACALIGFAASYLEMLIFTLVVTAIATDLGVTILGVVAVCAAIAIFFMAIEFLF